MIGSLILLTILASQEPAEPIEFRCDSMEVTQEPARSRCLGNAIARQNNILICCEAFVTKADQNWQWQTLHCVGDVRAQRDGELAWANEAIFKVDTGTLTLEGKPVLQRGKSLMQGKQIMIEKDMNKARVIKPKGIMHHNSDATELLKTTNKELPSRCPLPPRPKKVTQ